MREKKLWRKRKLTLFWMIMCIQSRIHLRKSTVLKGRLEVFSLCISMHCGEGTFTWPLGKNRVSLHRRNWFCHHTLQHPRWDIRGRGGYLLKALQTAEAAGCFGGAASQHCFIYSLLLLFIKRYLGFVVLMSMRHWSIQRQSDRSGDKEDRCPYDYSNRSE